MKKHFFNEFYTVVKDMNLSNTPSIKELVDIVSQIAQDMIKESDKQQAEKTESDESSKTEESDNCNSECNSESKSFKDNTIDKLIQDFDEMLNEYVISEKDNNTNTADVKEETAAEDKCCCKNPDCECVQEDNCWCESKCCSDNTTINRDSYDALVNEQVEWENKFNIEQYNSKKSPLYHAIINSYEDAYNKHEAMMHENIYPAILRYVEKQLFLLIHGKESKACWNFEDNTARAAVNINTEDLDYKISPTDFKRVAVILKKYLNCKNVKLYQHMLTLYF